LNRPIANLIYYAYNILLTLLSPLLILYFKYKGGQDIRYIGTMDERFGHYADSLRKVADARRIWVHTVSVGEVVGAMPLLRMIQARLPDYELVVSTTTVTGRQMLQKNFPDMPTFYFPFDFPWVARRTVNHIAPDALVLMETELWPNVMTQCARRDAPVMLLNGRVSERMAKAGGMVAGMYRWAFARITALGMQTPRDAERITALGAPRQLVTVVGNMKFDGLLTKPDFGKIQELRDTINPDARPLFVAGSTHPGEEAILCDVFRRVREHVPDLLMVVAPRHIERTDEVEGVFLIKDYNVQRRSRIKPQQIAVRPDVIILDTIGELRTLYAIADTCFVGGSLIERGGHNVLEPAACGKAPFYGPSMQNFLDSVEALEKGGGGRPVNSGVELAEHLIAAFKEPDVQYILDQNALEVIKANAGASERAFNLLQNNLS
jgi:3-deoxy-D-manno-octulosonic-acid transferase